MTTMIVSLNLKQETVAFFLILRNLRRFPSVSTKINGLLNVWMSQT